MNNKKQWRLIFVSYHTVLNPPKQSSSQKGRKPAHSFPDRHHRWTKGKDLGVIMAKGGPETKEKEKRMA